MADSGSGGNLNGEEVDEIPQRDPNSDVDISESSSAESGNETLTQENEMEFDSDDDIPLADLRPLSDFQRWSSRIRKPHINQFSQQTGPNLGDEPMELLDYFYLFFSEDFFSTLADETNRYARQEIEKKRSTRGKGDSTWEEQGETSAQEMKAFISTVINMGIDHKPQVEDYRSTNERLRNGAISKAMTINRWRKLNQYIHLSDNEKAPDENDPNRDRLFKVRPLLDMCNRNFKNGKYLPSRDLSIDEAMIGFKGRCYMKMYLPGKPTKWGLKSWMLAEAKTGFCIHADIYTGTKAGQGVTEGLGYHVVMDLAQHISGKYHHLYFDNYFTSAKLMMDLLSIQTYSCGTVRNNRKGLPPGFNKKTGNQDRGTISQWQKGDVLATKWKDRKDVYLLSTACGDNVGEVSRRLGKTSTHVRCPEVVMTYNRFMGGVDLSDHLRSYYQIGKKARRYWKYNMWFLIELCLINAWIVFHKANPQKKTVKFNQKDFCLAVCDALEAGYTSRKRRLSQTRPVLGVMNQENIGHHKLVRVEGRKRVCRHCSRVGRKTQTGRRIESSFACDICQVTLCQDRCFYEYHS